jgi:hypothetical protein
MNKSLYLFLIVAGVLLFPAVETIAAPEQALLVDEKGDVVAGYSTVIIDNGLAYPVRNFETSTWYGVIVTGTAADGTILCTVGEPMGTIPEGVGVDEGESDEEEIDDDGDPSQPGE